MEKKNAAALAAFERHRPLAERIARAYRRRFHGGTLSEEVTAAALIGLWQAALSKPNLPDGEFLAFASFRIRGAIIDEIRAHDPLPRRARKNLGPILFLSIDAAQGGSNDSPADNTQNLYPLLAQFAVEPDAESTLFAKERSAIVAPAIAQLRRRDREVLALLMRRTPVEVARYFDISEARVSQIWTRIVATLRASLGLAPPRRVRRDWGAIGKKKK